MKCKTYQDQDEGQQSAPPDWRDILLSWSDIIVSDVFPMEKPNKLGSSVSALNQIVPFGLGGQSPSKGLIGATQESHHKKQRGR